MKEYKTSDLYLAAYLKAKGMRILETVRAGQRSIFVFDDGGNSKNLVQEFFNDGSIGVTTFKNALQDLKTMLYNI